MATHTQKCTQQIAVPAPSNEVLISDVNPPLNPLQLRLQVGRIATSNGLGNMACNSTNFGKFQLYRMAKHMQCVYYIEAFLFLLQLFLLHSAASVLLACLGGGHALAFP